MAQPFFRRLRDIELVLPTDQRFRAFLAMQAIRNKHISAPAPVDSRQQLGLVIENIVRKLLATRGPLLDQRILRYSELLGGHHYVERFRELDAVQARDGKPRRVVEVKASHKQSNLSAAHKQLSSAIEVLGRIAPRVAGVLVWVQTASVTSTRLSVDWAELEDLDELDQWEPGQTRTALVRLHLPDLETWAQSSGAVSVDEQHLFVTARAEADASEERRRRREELRASGIPKEMWPADLQPVAPERRAGGVMHDPIEQDAPSDFASALSAAFAGPPGKRAMDDSREHGDNSD